MSSDAIDSMENIPLAFYFTLGASLATIIGSLSAFFVRLQDKKVLAGSLGLSAGVMLYVSFIEIFAEAREKIANSGVVAHESALLHTTIYFFTGMIVIAVLDVIVHHLGHENEHDLLEVDMEDRQSASAGAAEKDVGSGADENDVDTEAHIDKHPHQDRDLKRASLVAALAVTFHNIPEGLTTFMSTLTNPKVGLSVSIAIGLHNILEGLCVAMPLYFATGSRWRAFLWSALSGGAEFLGAVLGYAVLASFKSEFVMGILAAIVAGMMVFVSTRELLPVARRYDPKDKVVTWSLLSGMGLMAISLVLSQ